MSDEARLAGPDDAPGEDDLDRSLRPKTLAAFVGQPALREKLGIFLQAARQRGEALDHVLLAGPPGLGKTSLAYIVRAVSPGTFRLPAASVEDMYRPDYRARSETGTVTITE